jgi:tRNA U34 5-methylaminomethyl-2-thiouridine-forming methyltransferase MnmC
MTEKAVGIAEGDARGSEWPKVVMTDDGSPTLQFEGLHSYRSLKGAMGESHHVFIENGLNAFQATKSRIRVLEVGIGTCLNAANAARWALKRNQSVLYVGLEPYPLNHEVLAELEYPDAEFINDIQEDLAKLNEATPWIDGLLHEHYHYHLLHSTLKDFDSKQAFDVVFFDPFSEATSPELWTEEALTQVANLINPGGLLVTYACTGHLRKTFNDLGFTTERLPGALGKKHMFRATKPELLTTL